MYDERCDSEAKNGTGDDFFWLVADALFEAGKFRFVEFEFGDDVIDVFRVFAHVDSETECVHDDDDSEADCDTERG